MPTRLHRMLSLLTSSLVLSACAWTPTPPTPSQASQALPAAPIQARTLMETLTSWDGKGLKYPAGIPKVTALEIVVAPGADTGWHLHPVPSLAYIVEGSLEITLRDGTSRRLATGQTVAEVVDTLHLGRNPGDRPTRLIVFYLGTTDSPLTIAAPR